MTKRTPKDQQREELINLKFEKMRIKIEGECQNKMRKKQEELPIGGYKQGVLRGIKINKIKKLAEGLAAIDKEVYGDPTKEADKNRILNRVKLLVDAHIESLIKIETERRTGPRVQTRRYKEVGVGIISNIKSNLLISMKEKKLSPRVRPSKFSSIKNWRMNHPLVALLVTIVAGVIVLSIGYFFFKNK